jgi:hypothetical protein
MMTSSVSVAQQVEARVLMQRLSAAGTTGQQAREPGCRANGKAM